MRYTKDEIWSEIDRILDEDKKRQFTPGQQIYYNAHYCISPYFFIDTETNLFLEEINISQRLTIPIASSIENSEYHHLVILSAISEEIDACNIVKKRKENGKK